MIEITGQITKIQRDVMDGKEVNEVDEEEGKEGRARKKNLLLSRPPICLLYKRRDIQLRPLYS